MSNDIYVILPDKEKIMERLKK